MEVNSVDQMYKTGVINADKKTSIYYRLLIY